MFSPKPWLVGMTTHCLLPLPVNSIPGHAYSTPSHARPWMSCPQNPLESEQTLSCKKIL
jgi:hypothetical protein